VFFSQDLILNGRGIVRLSGRRPIGPGNALLDSRPDHGDDRRSSAQPPQHDALVQTEPKEGACMELAFIRSGSLLETLVLLVQVAGIGGLLLSRLVPATPWAWRGRVVVVLALVALALLGSACNPHSSGMGLYAGGTMTVLFVGMISGGSHPSATDSTLTPDVVERPVAI
jgi:hypothetical protein